MTNVMPAKTDSRCTHGVDICNVECDMVLPVSSRW